jgi:hypothetical protein
MRTEVTGELLVAVAGDVGFPPTRLGSLMLSDEGAWRYAIARATPAERMNLIVALGPELLAATEGGRRRIAAQQETRIADQTRWPGTRDVDGEPSFYGDPELLGTVKAALALVPPMVRYAVQAEVAFLSVGVSSTAWCQAYRRRISTLRVATARWSRSATNWSAMGPCIRCIRRYRGAHRASARPEADSLRPRCCRPCKRPQPRAVSMHAPAASGRPCVARRSSPCRSRPMSRPRTRARNGAAGTRNRRAR